MVRSPPMLAGSLLACACLIACGNPVESAKTTAPAAPTAAVEAEPSAPEKGVEPEKVVAELNADGTAPDAAREGALVDLVVLISVDGLRPDVIFPHARMIERMRQKGTHAANARTVAKATTLPSHASMVSGVEPLKHGLSFNSYKPEGAHIQYPTIFSAAQDAGLTTGVFVGKRKLQHLLDPSSVTHFEVGGAFCHRVTKLALPYLAAAESGVVFMHFSDPDGAGHEHGWMSKGYVDAVRRSDRCVADVVKALRKRGDMERTMVLLTADHGGHDHRHGSRLKADKHIPWILWGGPVQPKRIRRPVYTTDTAATILHALGLKKPSDITGKAILDGLGGPEGG